MGDEGRYRPDWYPDPLGRFDYRYWDGDVWTPWVSRGGDLRQDPPTALTEAQQRNTDQLRRGWEEGDDREVFAAITKEVWRALGEMGVARFWLVTGFLVLSFGIYVVYLANTVVDYPAPWLGPPLIAVGFFMAGASVRRARLP